MMKKRDSVSYSIDTSSLIHGWRRAYRPKNFNALWERLDEIIGEGRLIASAEVLHELKKKDDELHTWCRNRQNGFSIEIDDPCQEEVARLMKKYPRLVDTAKGRSTCDPFVIALAGIANPSLVVVTEEFEGRVRIPEVCDGEGLRWMRLADLIEEEGWVF